MKLFTYYADVPDLPRFDETKLILLWRELWAAAGVEPVVLNEWHAQQHPFYNEYRTAIEKLPSCNPARYEAACFMRWLALAQVGDGWMADYDVMPINASISVLKYRPLPSQTQAVTIYQTPCCPCLVHTAHGGALKLCQEFATGKFGNRPQGHTDSRGAVGDAGPRGHFSDQYALEDMAISGAIKVLDVVKHFSDVDWTKAPAVHFPNAVMQPKGLTPKWKHVRNCLKTK